MNKDNELAKALRKAIKKNNQKPPHVRFQEMVSRGVIDTDGKVLIRMPKQGDY